MTNEPDPIDISMALGSINDVTISPPFSGTTTIVYPYLLDEDQKDLREGMEESELSYFDKIEKFGPYFGEVLLLDLCNSKEPEITSNTLLKAFASVEQDFKSLPENDRYFPPRLLVKTRRRHEKPGDSYSYFSIDAVEFLYAQALRLVGIDTPSINKPGGDDLIEWQFKDRQIVWLINVDLSDCKGSGKYILVAMPLVDVEEGPVPTRAILLPKP